MCRSTRRRGPPTDRGWSSSSVLDGVRRASTEDDHPMLVCLEEWMNVGALKAMRQAGATWADIGREAGCDWRTVEKCLSVEGPVSPPAVTGRTPVPRVIDPYTDLVDGWLAGTPRLQASVIHQRLVAEY